MNGGMTPVSRPAGTTPWQGPPEQNGSPTPGMGGAEHALDGMVRGSTKTAAIPAHETREQQQMREAAAARIVRRDQLIREKKEHAVAFREQQIREAREHGLPPPPAMGPPPAPPIPSQSSSGTPPTVIIASSGAVPSVNTDAWIRPGAGGFHPFAVKLRSARSGVDEAPASPVSAGGVVAGTHPLRPIPKNGGERSEAPTTVADINAIINDIDPTLLTDPSQKGVGRLKGLPYGKMFEAAGAATGIDPAILYADAQVETGDNKHGRILVPNNINPIQTAPGVWPTTANAATNLFTGAYVMRDYINRADGDLKRGLNAYNTGNLAPGETGFADGYAGYYEGVMAALSNVEQALKDPSIIEPGQGGNVSIESQI